MRNADYNIDELLGMQVDYYYLSEAWNSNEENDDVLVCASVSAVNTVTTILARDIVSFDGKTLKYKEGGKSKTITINSNIDVIYNGVACPDYEEAMLSPQSGKLTYIDNGSGIDCVKVEEYKNGIVTLANDEYITMKNGLKIETDKFSENELFLYDKDGNQVEPKNIPVNSVLSMYYSHDGSILKAVYSENTLEKVKIQAFNDESVTVNEQEYYVNKLYLNWQNSVKSIETATYKIYLDVCGEVARIEKASGGVTFGYLISTYKNDAGDGTVVKILVEEGGIECIECNTKINVDGSQISSADLETELKYQDKIEQLITYQTDGDGKISKINTAVNRDTYTGSVKDNQLNDFKISYKAGSSEYYKTGINIFGASCPVDETTKVFYISENPKNQTDEYYWSGSISFLSNDERVTSAIGYKTSSEIGNAEAMVVYGVGENGKITSETRIAVVKETGTTVVNEDGELRERVTFITSGKLVAYNLKESLNPEEYNLSEGDIVRFAIDRNYEVDTIEMLCDLKSDGSMALRYGESNNYTNNTNAGGAVYRVVSGSAYDYEGGLLCLSKGDINGINLENPQFEYYKNIAGAFICVVDKNEITAGSDADIVRYTDDPEDYSKMFISTRYGVVRDVVIYK